LSRVRSLSEFLCQVLVPHQGLIAFGENGVGREELAQASFESRFVRVRHKVSFVLFEEKQHVPEIDLRLAALPDSRKGGANLLKRWTTPARSGTGINHSAPSAETALVVLVFSIGMMVSLFHGRLLYHRKLESTAGISQKVGIDGGRRDI
jgi:hypothetical protein